MVRNLKYGGMPAAVREAEVQRGTGMRRSSPSTRLKIPRPERLCGSSSASARQLPRRAYVRVPRRALRKCGERFPSTNRHVILSRNEVGLLIRRPPRAGTKKKRHVIECPVNR